MNLWAVTKMAVNSDFKKPLNEKLDDFIFTPQWLFTASATWTPPVKGRYRIICIGAGGDGNGTINPPKPGGAGGVVIGVYTLGLISYNITAGTGNSSFGSLVTAEAGSRGAAQDATPAGGSGGTVYQASGANVGIYLAGGSMSAGGDSYYVSGTGPAAGGGGGFGGGGGASSARGKIRGGSGVLGGNGGSGSAAYNGIGIGGLGGGNAVVDTTSNLTASGSGGNGAVIVQLIEEVY